VFAGIDHEPLELT